jgi:hypothetical protein
MKSRDGVPHTQYGYRADLAKMPDEKPAWKMTAEEFANHPPSLEWFKWVGWQEGYLYCHWSREYALSTGWPCLRGKVVRDGLVAASDVIAITEVI